ncbi:MAG TPA: NUDIX hydrolase [Caulobacteraceae bacterium]|jgi:8-oxo-dGTP pyrophosphatase MutT (NUDIX family)
MAARTPKQGSKKHVGRGVQYAALPYRWTDGLVQILMVTSRETGRWVLPKGWPMARKKPHAAAGREAMEEAGVTGKIRKTPIGSYDYLKRLKTGGALVCTVKVYPLEVVRQLKRWPEQDQRTPQWFTPEEAAKAVHEPDLAALIRAFGAAPPQPRTKPKTKVAPPAQPAG